MLGYPFLPKKPNKSHSPGRVARLSPLIAEGDQQSSLSYFAMIFSCLILLIHNHLTQYLGHTMLDPRPSAQIPSSQHKDSVAPQQVPQAYRHATPPRPKRATEPYRVDRLEPDLMSQEGIFIETDSGLLVGETADRSADEYLASPHHLSLHLSCPHLCLKSSMRAKPPKNFL